jgi:hypothetical protein
MGTHANYEIVTDVPGVLKSTGGLVIRDLGPWDVHFTVTNDAECVVQRLLTTGALAPGQRLFYWDSEGLLDELLVKDGNFAGFAPGPR